MLNTVQKHKITISHLSIGIFEEYSKYIYKPLIYLYPKTMCNKMIKTIIFLLVVIYCQSFASSCEYQHPNVQHVYEETISNWESYYTRDEMKLLQQGITFATVKHQGQFRKSRAEIPYIIHPLRVANHLFEIGQIRSINILLAALLHDTLEDTNTTPNEIEHAFGKRVLYTVQEVTNTDKQLQIDKAPHLSFDAQLVKIADRLDNIRDLQLYTPVNWSAEKLTNYCQWGQKLLHVLPHVNLALNIALQREIDTCW